MADRYDFIIYGASGYTGYYCVKNLIKINLEKNKNYSFAVAGRDEAKIRKNLIEVGEDLRQDTSSIKIILANSDSKNSLINMTRQAKVLITVVGPYSLYGRPVVEACIETNTHYVDICGEPQFVESIQNDFFDEAKSKGLFIISSCGLDSIPADLGIVFLKDQCQDIEIRTVEGYLSMKTPNGFSINTGTFFSLLESLRNYNQLRSIRDTMFAKFYKKKVHIPKAPKKKFPHKAPYSNGFFVPFYQIDSAVVKRTQLFFYNENENDKPVSIVEYLNIPTVIQAIGSFLTLILVSLLTNFEYLKNLVKQNPKLVDYLTLGVFSSRGSTKEQIKSSSFEFYFIGKGVVRKNPSITATKTLFIRGPEAGYDATSLMTLNAGFIILEELSDNQINKSGVISPGYAFKNSNYVTRIRDLGIQWEIIDN